MTVLAATMTDRVVELRETFDRSFAKVTSSDAGTVERLLGIMVGDDPYLLRLSELSGLHVNKKVTWLPSPVTELLGIAGFRDEVVPVYDLGMLLGAAKAAAPRWMVVTADARIGLAFASFDGYLNVPSAAIVAEARVETRDWHVREILRTEYARPIIHLPSILEAIGRRAAGHDKQI
jgi:purine-binding chemotaxis protein CheW